MAHPEGWHGLSDRRRKEERVACLVARCVGRSRLLLPPAMEVRLAAVDICFMMGRSRAAPH